MTRRQRLNGVDCLMLAFDYQLQHHGFAGNAAQIVLGLPEAIPAREIERRVAHLASRLPILKASLVQHWWKGYPYWRLPDGFGTETGGPCFFTHEAPSPDNPLPMPEALEKCRKDIFNTRLRTDRGRWLRFDLIYLKDSTSGTAMEVIMTWHHAFMDAHGAEFLLHLIGDETAMAVFCKTATTTEGLFDNPVLRRRLDTTDIKTKWQWAGRAFQRIDGMAADCPGSLFTALKACARPRLEYRLTAFSEAETDSVTARCRKIGGILNDSGFLMAAGVLALNRLHHTKRVAGKSYVVSFPVDLRKIGTRFPVFGNQAGTLLYLFKQSEVTDLQSLVASFRAQTRAAVRDDLLFANACTLDLSRILPSWFYTRKIRQSLKGEIASLIFANPGPTFAALSAFMGLPVTRQFHVPAVVTPPGIGIVFYTFRKRLQMSLVFADGLLTAEEADAFVADIRGHLTGEG